MRKAIEFYDAARLVVEMAEEKTDMANAFVTLCVNSGIAAADVICCARLGRYSAGEDHQQAVALLATAMREAAPLLNRLLGIKSKAEYLHTSVSTNDSRLADRAAARLLELARGA